MLDLNQPDLQVNTYRYYLLLAAALWAAQAKGHPKWIQRFQRFQVH